MAITVAVTNESHTADNNYRLDDYPSRVARFLGFRRIGRTHLLHSLVILERETTAPSARSGAKRPSQDLLTIAAGFWGKPADLRTTHEESDAIATDDPNGSSDSLPLIWISFLTDRRHKYGSKA
jgi:hypothetical protein